MRRARLRRIPPSSAVLLVVAAAVIIVDAFILHGTPATHEQVTPHLRAGVQHIGVIDYVRIALGVLAAVLVGYALVRWADADQQDETSDADGSPRMFGDSIVDARTQVDPAIGMGPVKMTRDR
jgi:hypothetical protein